MGLEDDLKARTSALISQQMANWVVEIQRAIQGHQATLVRALDDLGETVARYDEKIDEQSIAAAMAEVLAQQPPAAATADYSALKASLGALDKGANLSEVLTHLVGEVAKHVDRAAMFILKGNAAVGWYARGFDHNEVVKAISIPLTADTLFRVVSASRHATRGHVTHSPGTSQALSRLGGDPQGVLAVPLILRDKVAAVLYCDTPQDEVPLASADIVEIMVAYAGKVIDVLSAHARAGGPAPAPGGTSPGTHPGPAAAPALETASRGFAAEPGAMRAQASAATVFRPPTGAARPPLRRPSPPVDASGAGPLSRGPEGPRRRQAVRPPRRERDQALQRGQGHGGAQDEGHLRAPEGGHRTRAADVRRPRGQLGARRERLLLRRARADPGRGRPERPRTHVGAGLPS